MTIVQPPPSLAPLLSPVKVGREQIDVPIFLAPMAGVTDRPFRTLVRSFGAGLVVSEMIASQAMIREVRKTLQMIEPADKDDILTIQIAGSDPVVMAQAAQLNADRGARIIDINFGCPVKKIVNGEAGSALMKDEVRAGRILEAVVKAVSLPVTVKMRLGWSAETINAPRLAKIAEESGIQMVTVHGRTRNQFYNGVADWRRVRAVKENVKIPVIVNGDITDEASLRTALAESGADGAMIGRGTYGRPWLLRQMMDVIQTGQTSPFSPTIALRAETVQRHLEDMLVYYGEVSGLRMARKHMGWYSKGLAGASEFRAAINTVEDAARARSMVAAFFEPLVEAGA